MPFKKQAIANVKNVFGFAKLAAQSAHNGLVNVEKNKLLVMDVMKNFVINVL